MDNVAGPATAGPNRAGDEIRPDVNIMLRVTHHGGLAGRTAGGMDTHHFLARYRKHVKRVVVPQVLLSSEGKLRYVGQGFEVVRMYAGLLESLAVMRHVLVSMAQRPLHPFKLQRLQFIPARVLDGIPT